MPTFTMTKTYNSVDFLLEADLDNMKNSTETFMNSTKLDETNIQVDAVGQNMTSTGANAIGLSMTATGADGVLSSISTAGSGSMAATFTSGNADTVASKFSTAGTASIASTSTAADADAIVAKLTTSGANHIATASMNATGFNAIGAGMTNTGANAVLTTVDSTTAADHIANLITATGDRTILVGVARNQSTTPTFFDVGVTASSGSASTTTLSIGITALNNKTYKIGLVSDASSSLCSVKNAASVGQVLIKRGVTTIAAFEMAANTTNPPGGFFVFDTPSAGSFTYTASIVNNVTFNFVSLSVMAV